MEESRASTVPWDVWWSKEGREERGSEMVGEKLMDWRNNVMACRQKILAS